VRWLEHRPRGHLQHWREAVIEFNLKRHWLPRKVGCAEVMLALWSCFNHLLEFGEQVDPDLDVMNVYASATLAKAKDELFRKQWKAFPAVAEMGLFHTLIVLIVASAIWQLLWYSFSVCNTVNEVHAWPGSSAKKGSERLSGFLNDIQGMADIAGLLALGSLFRTLQASEGIIPPNRGRNFVASVFPETMGFAWFTISLMSMTYGDGNMERFVNACLSVATSFLAAGRGLAMLPPLFKWHWSKREHTHNKKMLCLHTTFGTFVFLAFCVMAVRVAGVWLCESHDFEMHSLKCLEPHAAIPVRTRSQ